MHIKITKKNVRDKDNEQTKETKEKIKQQMGEIRGM